MTEPSLALVELAQRFRSLQSQRDNHDLLIQDLIVYCQGVESTLRQENDRLSTELQDALLDLEDSRRSRRELQTQLTKLKQANDRSNADYDQIKNRNPYIIALVDGDGMIFNESLINQGIEGGKTAANILRNSIIEHCGELSDDFEVIVKVCANITGLGKALQRDGSLHNIDDFKDFTLGFTQGKASFDFIDVGHGKERADSKIKENMRWHLRNHNCKQILLGISHDAGYAPFLDEILKQDDRNRVTIMEGSPTVRELTSVGVQIINFNNIFRPEKLINRATVPLTAQANTWAGVTSINPPPQSPSPVNIKPANGTKKPVAKTLWNPGPRGLDEPITVTSAALEKVKRRSADNKLCNNHYLRGMCSKGDECCFEHNYKVSDEEWNAMLYLTRLVPCGNGQDCEQEDCIYGHHCSSPAIRDGRLEGGVCTVGGCRYGEDGHPPGMVIKNPRKEKW